MGWKGTLRTLSAASNASEREARRRQNALVKRQKQIEKMEELEKAKYEVEVYENQLEIVLSIHKGGWEIQDWEAIQGQEPPVKPVLLHHHEEAAKTRLQSFKPNMVDKLLKRADAKQEKLIKGVAASTQLDEQEFQEALKTYEQDLEEWESIRNLAGRILAHEPKAYMQAIKQTDIFSEIKELGSSLKYQIHDSVIEAYFNVQGEEAIPRDEKRLLKSGKLSVKEMPKTKFFSLYQDYVCGCVLRIAKGIFALLPIEMAIVTAFGKVLDTKTGHLDDSPILSAVIPRKTIFDLNFKSLDPSDSMSNFVHRMNFKKGIGFAAVEKISSSELQSGGLELKPE
jgi:DNA-binding transcriptional regulator YiaG